MVHFLHSWRLRANLACTSAPPHYFNGWSHMHCCNVLTTYLSEALMEELNRLSWLFIKTVHKAMALHAKRLMTSFNSRTYFDIISIYSPTTCKLQRVPQLAPMQYCTCDI